MGKFIYFEKYAEDDWNVPMSDHRCFQVAGLPIRVESDLPITETTFSQRLKLFEFDGPEEGTILIKHFFGLPDLKFRDLGEKVVEQLSLTIFRKSDGWIYFSKGYDDTVSDFLHQVSFVNPSHTRVEVYNERDSIFRNGDLAVLSFFPSDWLLIARVLADRQGCMFHSSGVVLDGKGFLFVGHSGAGKSTMVKMLLDKAEILCDERIITRKVQEGFRIYGTWTHGEVPIFSASSAPLKAILFLKQARKNRITLIHDKAQAIARLSACAFKPLATGDWWENTLSFMEELIAKVPCCLLEFDQSGEVVHLLRDFK